MTKLGIFFCNKGIDHVDCRHISTGNPGLGGTPFMFYVISYLLSARDNGIDVLLLTTHKGIFPDNIKTGIAANLHEAYQICEEQDFDYLLVKHYDYYAAADRFVFTKAGKTKLLVWCHNFASYKALHLYAKSPNVCKIVAVGREQMDLYRDHRAFLKSEYIYNCIDVPLLSEKTFCLQPFGERKNIVTYMGAVIRGKGFHILAKAWKEVVRQVPDAELYVIGSGNLYGDGKLGKWNLAEEKYENSFMKYLTKDGKVLPSVHLMGVLGQEKFDILRRTKVGVPNPSGLTETFCICGVEMQMAGARITSIRCAGYLDTVVNGTLYRKRSQLAENIVTELKRKDSDYAGTVQFINDNFSQSVVASEWERLLKECIPQGTHLHEVLPLTYHRFKLKWLKEYFRKLKSVVPFLYTVLPALGPFLDLWDKVDYKLFKLRNGFI